MTWQKGNHRMKFGGLFEYAPGTGFWGYCDPACDAVFSPESSGRLRTGAADSVVFPEPADDDQDQCGPVESAFLPARLSSALAILGQPPPYNINTRR